MFTKERTKQVISYALIFGDQEAIEVFKLTAESLARYRRAYRDMTGDDPTVPSVIQKIKSIYSDEELKAIANGGRIVPGQTKVPVVSFDGEEIIFAHITDTHIGSIYFIEKYFIQAINECRKQGVQFICHTGDVVDGMSNRDGHVYELTHIGYHAQKQYAIEIMSKWEGKWYMIDGNHDRWFKKSNGAIVVKDICDGIPEAQYLGHDNADLSLNGKCIIRLWHGEDHSSYAVSYRVQQLIGSFTGGDKPNILLCGHTHKQGYFFDRHIHAVTGGALSLQSSWMKSKRLANHTGFWIIKAKLNKGVAVFSPTWYPYYS